MNGFYWTENQFEVSRQKVKETKNNTSFLSFQTFARNLQWLQTDFLVFRNHRYRNWVVSRISFLPSLDSRNESIFIWIV